MITDLIIENFKCFKNLAIHELPRITLVGGRNNVGKTALLEAIFLFFDRASAAMTLKQYGWRGLESVTSSTEGVWTPIFRKHKLTQGMSISAHFEGKQQIASYKYCPYAKLELLPKTEEVEESESLGSPSEKSVRTDLEAFPSASIEIEYYEGSRLILTSRLFMLPDGRPSISHDRTPVPEERVLFLPAKYRLTSKECSDRFSRTYKDRKEHCVFEFLSIIEPRLTNVTILMEGGEPVIHGDVGLGPQPISLLGGGMTNLLQIIVTMGQAKNPILLIDEIENGIYRRLLPTLWESLGKYADKFNCQIIATTHSTECVEAAYQGLASTPQDLQYIRLDRENDTISAKVSDYEMLGAAIQHGLEMR